MAVASSKQTLENSLEDPLAYLPCSSILEYKKDQLVYSQDHPSNSIYLIIDGQIKVSRVDTTGRQVLIDIYRPDEFFGESGLLSLPHRPEHATALEKTHLMVWSVKEIETVIATRPRLGVALLQVLSRRIIATAHQLESFSADSISRRLARSLIRFAKRQGVSGNDIGPEHVVFWLVVAFLATAGTLILGWPYRYMSLAWITSLVCRLALTERDIEDFSISTRQSSEKKERAN